VKCIVFCAVSSRWQNAATAIDRRSVIQWRIHEFVKGGRPLPFLPLPSLSLLCPLSLVILSPSPSVPFPLEVGPLKLARRFGERCKLPQRGPGRRPDRKRIWCTLKLSKSHCWQSLWIFWSACLTVERSKSSTHHNTVPFSLIRSAVTASVRRPGGAGLAPL